MDQAHSFKLTRRQIFATVAKSASIPHPPNSLGLINFVQNFHLAMPLMDITNGDDASGKKTIEQTYQKKSQLEHILLRPDTYIGCEILVSSVPNADFSPSGQWKETQKSSGL